MQRRRRQWQRSKEKKRQTHLCQGAQSVSSCPPKGKVFTCFALPTFCTNVFCITCWGTTAERASPRACEAPESHQGSSPARQRWESNCEIAAPEGPWAQPWATGASQGWRHPVSTTNDAESQQLPCIYSVIYAPGGGITQGNSLRKFFGQVQRVTTFISMSRGIERIVFLFGFFSYGSLVPAFLPLNLEEFFRPMRKVV